jgi:hypothetical protein
MLTRFGLKDSQFDRQPTKLSVVSRFIVLLLLLPLWVVSLVPNILIYTLPKVITKRMTDKMFRSTMLIGSAIFVTVPLLYGGLFLTLSLVFNIFVALAYLLVSPLLILFAWYYYQRMRYLYSDIVFLRLKRKIPFRRMKQLRSRLYSRLNEIKNRHSSQQI